MLGLPRKERKKQERKEDTNTGSLRAVGSPSDTINQVILTKTFDISESK